MDFDTLDYEKNVEGNHDVYLVKDNTRVARITFPTQFLAKEYMEFKCSSTPTPPLAERLANLEEEVRKLGEGIKRERKKRLDMLNAEKKQRRAEARAKRQAATVSQKPNEVREDEGPTELGQSA